MKEDVKQNLFMEIAEMMGRREITSHKVINSIQRITKQSHIWVLQDEVFVLKKVKKKFIGFKNFRGIERLELATQYAKDFVRDTPKLKGELT